MALLTVKELADQLGVSNITIHRWKKNKGLPFKKLGYAVRFDLSEVHEWMEEKGEAPKLEKWVYKITDEKTGEENVKRFSTYHEFADDLMKAIADKKPEQVFYVGHEFNQGDVK